MASKQAGDLCHTLFAMEQELLYTYQNLEPKEQQIVKDWWHLVHARLERFTPASTNS